MFNLDVRWQSHGVIYAVRPLNGSPVSLSTIFQSYCNGVWMWQGAQCSLLELPYWNIRSETQRWYFTQSNHIDTELTSSDSELYFLKYWALGERAASTTFKVLYDSARDLICNLPSQSGHSTNWATTKTSVCCLVAWGFLHSNLFQLSWHHTPLSPHKTTNPNKHKITLIAK